MASLRCFTTIDVQTAYAVPFSHGDLRDLCETKLAQTAFGRANWSPYWDEDRPHFICFTAVSRVPASLSPQVRGTISYLARSGTMVVTTLLRHLDWVGVKVPVYCALLDKQFVKFIVGWWDGAVSCLGS